MGELEELRKIRSKKLASVYHLTAWIGEFIFGLLLLAIMVGIVIWLVDTGQGGNLILFGVLTLLCIGVVSYFDYWRNYYANSID